jgi:hypothetical protein
MMTIIFLASDVTSTPLQSENLISADSVKGQVPGRELNPKDIQTKQKRKKNRQKQLRRLKLFAGDSGHAASIGKTKYS